MGIENVKALIIFGARVHGAIKLSLNDRKIDGADIVNFLPALQALSPAVQGLEVIIPEVKDLDSGEVEQLIALIKQEDPALTSDVVAMERIAVCLKLGVAILETYKCPQCGHRNSAEEAIKGVCSNERALHGEPCGFNAIELLEEITNPKQAVE